MDRERLRIIKIQFPRLNSFRILQRSNELYNCVGWGVGDVYRWWWPNGKPFEGGDYWPYRNHKGISIEAFDDLFDQVNATTTDDRSVERGYVKVALFGYPYISSFRPTHTARQMHTGKWVSKLGALELIEHELEELEGSQYGNVIKIYKVRRSEWGKFRKLAG